MKQRLLGAGAASASLVVWLALLGPVFGQEPISIWEKHSWAKFGVGSWKQVRVYGESLNESGKVESTSITDTRTTLIDVTSTDFTVQVDVTVEVAGKVFRATPKLLKQGFNGETAGQSVELKSLGASEFVIDGQRVPVELRRVVINGDALKRVSMIHYSDRVVPYVLKRETKVTDASGTKPNYETMVEVVGMDMPFRVLSETKIVSQVKTVNRQADGASTVTIEVHCDDVPGGVVAHSVKEMNSAGQVISRSVLELTEYQVVPVAVEPVNSQTGRRKLFNRSRVRGG